MINQDQVCDDVTLDEVRRQARVLTSGVLGMRGDSELSQIVEYLATTTDFPFAAVSIVDRSQLWLAAAYGFDPGEFSRPHSFCDAAIRNPDFAPLSVPDAWKEERFMLAPAVIEMNVRAYFAAPLVTGDGLALGTLCLMDKKCRSVDGAALEMLSALAKQVSAIIDRGANARIYAQSAIIELSRRIQSAVARKDDAQVDILDRELRRLEKTLEARWQ